MIIDEAFNSDKLIEFLAALIKDGPKKVLLILDKLRVHHSKPVKAWLAEHKKQIDPLTFFVSSTEATDCMDTLLNAADSALRTLFAEPRASRACATVPESAQGVLSDAERELSSALMRVNHVGEVCAQALYTAQALAARQPWAAAGPREALAQQLEAAGREETDHLAWTKERLNELGARPSLLNPVWYAGAFGLGLLAGRLGPGVSLGFVVETERQVEAHLISHMERLPAGDHASRAIVAQMKSDEARHAREAQRAGATELPMAVKGLMRLAARVMTTVAHRV